MLPLRLINPRTLNVATRLASRRCLAVPSKSNDLGGSSQASATMKLMDFDPQNYDIPTRFVTMDDAMEPYGPWKVAYEAERKRANRTLLLGILLFSSACLFVVEMGVFDGAIMPNLDNIMEDTEPFEFEKEGRITV